MPKVTMVVSDADSENAERIRDVLGMDNKAAATAYALRLARASVDIGIADDEPERTIEAVGILHGHVIPTAVAEAIVMHFRRLNVHADK